MSLSESQSDDKLFINNLLDETKEPSTDELESLKSMVNDWFKYDDQIRKLQIAIKERKVHQKALNSKIENFMFQYKYKDLKYLQFVAQDNLSNIDPYSIEIYLNNEKLFYDFIPFRNLVRANISNYLQIGENTLNITIKDNLGNMKNINGDFTIIE